MTETTPAPKLLPDEAPTLVTGASGFVGGILARRLLASGRRVRALARSPLAGLAALGAETVRADVADEDAMRTACRDVGTVFHTAARVGVWGATKEFEQTNIGGARAILSACRSNGVRRLVFTSSPSVVFNGADLSGVDETQPRGTVFPAEYPRTKAEAERVILAANGTDGLATCALRPHLIWGIGDQNLLPRVIARAQAGRLRIVGSGENVVDLTHVENVVDAHVLAERVLAQAPAAAAGRPYFITNGEPVRLWDWINALLARLGIPAVTRRMSLTQARRIGAACECIWRALRVRGEPPMTRFVASELAKDHWFCIDAASRDLGYTPRVSMEEGLDEWIADWRARVAHPTAGQAGTGAREKDEGKAGACS